MKKDIYKIAGFAVRNLRVYKYFKFKDDNRETFPYKMVFMCGKEGIRYLNACLSSIYFSWNKLPEICIVSDGTSLLKFEKELIKWPRKMEVISWEHCAMHFKKKGDDDIYNFANQNIFGKKFASLLYYAEQHPFLYCDTDILWYTSPEEVKITAEPFIKMSKEEGTACYSAKLLKYLDEEKCLQTTPFNAGLMYLSGDFSVYPKWKALCKYVGGDSKDDIMAEQTSFAMMNNYFNANSYWNSNEVLIKTDDIYNLKYTHKYFPQILARHYVYTRPTAFWRDFVYMCMKKKPAHD
jgi:hypothetical protein